MSKINFSKTSFILNTFFLIMICSCSSSSSSNTNSSYSNFTISNSSVAVDNDYYSSHPDGSATVSRCTWYDSGKYFMVNGYVVNNNVVEKLTRATVVFESKPTVSGVYTIGTSGSLSTGECSILIVANSTFRTLTLGQTVNVSVNNGIVSIDIINLTFTTTTGAGIGTTSAQISGNIIEGK